MVHYFVKNTFFGFAVINCFTGLAQSVHTKRHKAVETANDLNLAIKLTKGRTSA